jgi:hypothetical protein
VSKTVKTKQLNGRSKSSKSVLFLSDLHIGSAYALCSPEPQVGDVGSVFKPNKLQVKLYDFWQDVQDSIQQKPLLLCLNGDAIDGANSKQIGQQSWSTNINDQLRDAVKLLKEIPHERFVMTRGSGYHVQKDATNYEESLAEKMNATPYSSYFDRDEQKIMDYSGSGNGPNSMNSHSYKTRTDYLLFFSVNDRAFTVTHHIAFTRWFNYQPMALAREMANLEYLTGKYWKEKDHPTFIVRSHVHYYVQVRFSATCGFTTPAWKFPDAHLFRGGLSGTAPSVGAIEVIVEPNGKFIVEPILMSNEEYPKHTLLKF